MASVCAAVEAHEADFGIIFDTDVDRAGCVGKGGYEINRNRLVALAAAICLEDNEDAVIVTDSITSDGLTEFIESRSGKHLRYMRGYKNVINKQVELTESGVNCPLAIETSGHAAFLENYFLDDGAYLVTKIIIEMAKLGRQGLSIEDLIADLR
jgi:phosphomannomutase